MSLSWKNGKKYMSDISPELQAQIDKARSVGQALAATEPRAIKAWYQQDTERIFIELTNGVVMGFPYQLLQGLEKGTATELAEVEITPVGSSLHWESLDADLSVPQLVLGVFGSKTWMTELISQQGRKLTA
jgi:Protein of unknown function (DUF2442)